MINKIIKKIVFSTKSQEKGVAILITFFIMGITLSVVLGISSILISEIKMIRSIGTSVVAFYAADTGIEEIIYFDNKKIPTGGTRGFCNICNVCADFGCQGCQLTPLADDGCNLITCQNCQISYCVGTGCAGTDAKKYNVTGSITPTEDITEDIFKSYGSYKGVSRAIELRGKFGIVDGWGCSGTYDCSVWDTDGASCIIVPSQCTWNPGTCIKALGCSGFRYDEECEGEGCTWIGSSCEPPTEYDCSMWNGDEETCLYYQSIGFGVCEWIDTTSCTNAGAGNCAEAADEPTCSALTPAGCVWTQ